MSPLHYAVVHGLQAIVDLLIQNKANVNAVDKSGRRPLHMIAWLTDPNSAKKIADSLLKHGAQINAQNNDDNTVLHTLVYNNRIDLINYLHTHYKPSWSLHNKDRETPAQLAKRLERKDVAQITKN
jgi:ankyrin repeat protein